MHGHVMFDIFEMELFKIIFYLKPLVGKLIHE